MAEAIETFAKVRVGAPGPFALSSEGAEAETCFEQGPGLVEVNMLQGLGRAWLGRARQHIIGALAVRGLPGKVLDLPANHARGAGAFGQFEATRGSCGGGKILRQHVKRQREQAVAS